MNTTETRLAFNIFDDAWMEHITQERVDAMVRAYGRDAARYYLAIYRNSPGCIVDKNTVWP
ncbi:MAG: hypothetical protein UY92_C0009G0005 [Candidatus Magasanikbacteria bacterium GW2011_GWA2_56_11]|uniref:Uncharacterized protein n=1 Tax=Candidatus Magasanikbacteria bacterium GW2011_GWA2_56_11 TaxID=1619044 RepID=A0A0G1YFJ1_9BACT|nr:MAG: hypothetical protein UY92_C0009G0005 [Candidatus Magasanikbacteria bacterium GW2011_GWA2_56_11]